MADDFVRKGGAVVTNIQVTHWNLHVTNYADLDANTVIHSCALCKLARVSAPLRFPTHNGRAVGKSARDQEHSLGPDT